MRRKNYLTDLSNSEKMVLRLAIPMGIFAGLSVILFMIFIVAIILKLFGCI